jgi:acetoacetate decarboxylase
VFTVATGGVAAGDVGAASALIGRKLRQNETSFLDARLACRSVLLCVGIPDFDAERRALNVLRRHAAHVHLHDLPAEPTAGQRS